MYIRVFRTASINVIRVRQELVTGSRITVCILAFLSNGSLQKLVDQVFASLVDQSILVVIAFASGGTAEVYLHVEIDSHLILCRCLRWLIGV